MEFEIRVFVINPLVRGSARCQNYVTPAINLCPFLPSVFTKFDHVILGGKETYRIWGHWSKVTIIMTRGQSHMKNINKLIDRDIYGWPNYRLNDFHRCCLLVVVSIISDKGKRKSSIWNKRSHMVEINTDCMLSSYLFSLPKTGTKMLLIPCIDGSRVN